MVFNLTMEWPPRVKTPRSRFHQDCRNYGLGFPYGVCNKNNGKLKIYIDYKRFNKATQKDHFPLPFDNQILDEVVGHEFHIFMDGHFGYNKVSIDPKIYYKTTFTMPWGTFIYVVMFFVLYNAPSTFQHVKISNIFGLLHNSKPKLIDVINNLQPPSGFKGSQRVLHYFGCYQGIMKDYAILAIPFRSR